LETESSDSKVVARANGRRKINFISIYSSRIRGEARQKIFDFPIFRSLLFEKKQPMCGKQLEN
jgi:hypothetical protein